MQSESGYHFISSFLSCQQKFYWEYIEGLVPKYRSKSLLFGDCIHKALAEYYSATKGGNKWLDCANIAIEKFLSSMRELHEEYQYEEDYLADLSKGIVLLQEYSISTEHDQIIQYNLETEVYKELTLPSGRVLTGNIDLIVGSNPPVIYDHKTTGWSISLSLQSLRMSNQATTYLSLCPQASHMVYNILYQKESKTVFHREIVYRTADDLQKWIIQADAILGTISANVGKSPDSWWRNDKNCFAYNHVCEYIDLCKGGKSTIGFKYRGERK
jgi:hypothetical protein